MNRLLLVIVLVIVLVSSVSAQVLPYVRTYGTVSNGDVVVFYGNDGKGITSAGTTNPLATLGAETAARVAADGTNGTRIATLEGRTNGWDAAKAWVAAYSNVTPTNAATVNDIDAARKASWDAGGSNSVAVNTNALILADSTEQAARIGADSALSNSISTNVTYLLSQDTLKVSKTGDTMTGTLTITTNLVVEVSGGIGQAGTAINKTNLIISGGKGISIGTSANGQQIGTAIGLEATALTSGVAVGYGAKGDSRGVAIGLGSTGTFGVAVGAASDGYSLGSAIGYGAVASNNGVAVGLSSIGYQDGIGIGKEACGYQNGIAMGKQSIAHDYGIGIGRATDGSYSNIAIGLGANAHPSNECIRRIAIGTATSNDVGNDTILVRGSLYLDGGSNVYYRTNFGSGAWTVGFYGMNDADNLRMLKAGDTGTTLSLTRELSASTGTVSGNTFAECLTNGTFTGSASSWTLGGSLGYDSGNLSILGSLTGSATPTGSVTPVAGDRFGFSFVVAQGTATVAIACGGASATFANATGSNDFFFKALNANSPTVSVTSITAATLDNFSLRRETSGELSAYHGSIGRGGLEVAGTIQAPNITSISNDTITKLSSNQWAAADSTTNYVRRTGDTMGPLTVSGGVLRVGALGAFGYMSMWDEADGAYSIVITNADGFFEIKDGASSLFRWESGSIYLDAGPIIGNASGLTNLNGSQIVGNIPTNALTNAVSALGLGAGGGVTNLYDLNNVDTVEAPALNDTIFWDGSKWTNGPLSASATNVGFANITGTFDQNESLSNAINSVSNVAASGLAGSVNASNLAVAASALAASTSATACAQALAANQAQNTASNSLQAQANTLKASSNNSVYTSFSYPSVYTDLTGTTARIFGAFKPFAWTMTNHFGCVFGGTSTVEVLDRTISAGTWVTITVFNVDVAYTNCPLAYSVGANHAIDYYFQPGSTCTNIGLYSGGVR